MFRVNAQGEMWAHEDTLESQRSNLSLNCKGGLGEVWLSLDKDDGFKIGSNKEDEGDSARMPWEITSSTLDIAEIPETDSFSERSSNFAPVGMSTQSLASTECPSSFMFNVGEKDHLSGRHVHFKMSEASRESPSSGALNLVKNDPPSGHSGPFKMPQRSLLSTDGSPNFVCNFGKTDQRLGYPVRFNPGMSQASTNVTESPSNFMSKLGEQGPRSGHAGHFKAGERLIDAGQRRDAPVSTMLGVQQPAAVPPPPQRPANMQVAMSAPHMPPGIFRTSKPAPDNGKFITIRAPPGLEINQQPAPAPAPPAAWSPAGVLPPQQAQQQPPHERPPCPDAAATAAGAISLGSQFHAAGKCTPCKFFRSRRGCREGENCRLCHYPHEELTYSSIRKNLRKLGMEKKRWYENEARRQILEEHVKAYGGNFRIPHSAGSTDLSNIPWDAIPGACRVCL